ncbi:chromatin assembly factor 1 subunit A domain-containing protein [Sarocladium implicatum]|nr:chromatin assembly factor 1 subunit A domain-containing protein [Sarocladium implicatum]
MSANVQKTANLKRCHDDFTGDDVVKPEREDLKQGTLKAIPAATEQLPLDITSTTSQQPQCLSPGLTDGGSSTPARQSPSPLTPLKVGSSQKRMSAEAQKSSTEPSTTQTAASGPPAKRKRLSAEEKEKREKEEAEKKREREEKQRQKAEEKAKADKEKAARAAEREEKRKKKEEEDRIKTQQRDEKKQQKEEELRRKQEAEERKAKAQPSLKSFFGAPRTAKDTSSIFSKSPQKLSSSSNANTVVSEYTKMFQPFFVKDHTRLAGPANQMDQETRDVKSKILDEYIFGERTHEPSPFDPVKALELPGRPPKRGCVHQPVRQIMETAYKALDTAQSNGGNEAENIMRETRRKLARIPVKVIAFSRDVRPPYYGTATSRLSELDQAKIRRLAQTPIGRQLELDYDYDSEAEWQEEEGEDVDIDDDEEEPDDEDDMDGFLDDSEDAGQARRIFANTMEPESTGICFEGIYSPDPILQEHKMEYIHELLGSDRPIDPWSTTYWEPEPKKAAATKALSKSEQSATMPPPPAPANAFAALSKPATSTTDGIKLVKDEVLDDVKRAILENKKLSKVGIVDVLYQQFRDRTSRLEVKNTIEFVAEKKGAGRAKEWELKPGHELKV